MGKTSKASQGMFYWSAENQNMFLIRLLGPCPYHICITRGVVWCLRLFYSPMFTILCIHLTYIKGVPHEYPCAIVPLPDLTSFFRPFRSASPTDHLIGRHSALCTDPQKFFPRLRSGCCHWHSSSSAVRCTSCRSCSFRQRSSRTPSPASRFSSDVIHELAEHDVHLAGHARPSATSVTSRASQGPAAQLPSDTLPRRTPR
ncbi:hypothetical protein EDB84DRAFT_741498 [Lactarius hengduanensis]|nr:hypothetical protein EDB84DRAFT_741498 [Lactarius hengduanensis]